MRIALTLLAATHLVVALWHGSAHNELRVVLPPAKNAFIYVVVLAAPLAAAAAVWTRYASLGTWAFFVSMVGAFIFGVYHHYWVISSDHVSHLPPGPPQVHYQFALSAAILAVVELSGAVVGVLFVRTTRGSSARRRATSDSNA